MEKRRKCQVIRSTENVAKVRSGRLYIIISRLFYYSGGQGCIIHLYYTTCISVPARKFESTGPGRYGEKFLRPNDKVQIFFKTSFKNTDRNKIGHDQPGPRFQPARRFTPIVVVGLFCYQQVILYNFRFLT